MKAYTKIYLDAFYPGHGADDYIPCEITGQRAVDIHHIDARGMGGNLNKDIPENLMALTRAKHLEYGDKKQYIDFLIEKHRSFMKARGFNLDENGFIVK